jgi:hypothetical protein
MNETIPPDRTSLTPEIRTLLYVPDDKTLEARQKSWIRDRRRFGILLGLALGLIYGAISQSINHLYLPDLPLYYPAPGPWLIALLFVLLGGALGFASAWPNNSLLGILLGGTIGALVMDIATLLETGLNSSDIRMVIAALFIIAMPLVASLALVVALFRGALDWHQRTLRGKGPLWLSAGIPLVLALLIGWMAVTSGYSPTARTLLVRARDLIEEGRAAAEPAALPGALRVNAVKDFSAHANQPYALEWDADPTNRYAIPRPLGQGGADALVIARFADGWTLVCLYTWVTAPPQCISLDG